MCWPYLHRSGGKRRGTFREATVTADVPAQFLVAALVVASWVGLAVPSSART
jgi:hypothetical protein